MTSPAVRPASAHATRLARVDLERLQVAQVDDEAAVGGAVAGAAVAAAADRELEPVVAGEGDDESDVGGVGRLTIAAGRCSS